MLTKDEVVHELVAMGLRIKEQARPENYAADRHHVAQRYASLLPQFRAAVRLIRSGVAPAPVLRALAKVIHGIEGNFVRRLLERVQS